MVKQGDIIRLNFSPQVGHEQHGYRLAVVLSNGFFMEKTNMTIVCPITNTRKPFPLHVELDERTRTTGVVLCEHLKAIDLEGRAHSFVEKLPEDLLDRIIKIVFAEIRRID